MRVERLRSWLNMLRKIAPERLLLLMLLVVTILLWTLAINSLPRPLEVVAFAVGDGDAFLIRAPSGRAVLLDGGSRSATEVGERVLVPNLMLLGVRKLDAIIITHPDSDHVNGLPAVLASLPVGMILAPGLPGESAAFQQVLEWAKEDDIPRHTLRAGDRLNLAKDVRLDILAPNDHLLTDTPSDDNNNSLVFMLAHQGTRMLFTGDLQLEGEQALLSRRPELRADIVKIAHHGSRFGTCDAFLDAAQPSRALISCEGSADGGHPHPDVLARLRARGIRVLRTDVHGQIRLTTDGKEWVVSTYRKALRETK